MFKWSVISTFRGVHEVSTGYIFSLMVIGYWVTVSTLMEIMILGYRKDDDFGRHRK